MPDKIAPKRFKPIPEDAPARELGEYLRAMVRESGVSLDRIAAAGGMAKNTLTTTMNGQSKEWPSVLNWITAYSKAFRGPEARQMADIRRLYQLGRDRHLAALSRPRTAQTAAPAAAQTTESADPGDIRQPSPESLLTEVYIPLPRRTPGAGIDAHLKRFLTKDEIEARIATIKHLERRQRLRDGPVSLHQDDPWFALADYRPRGTVYRSAVVHQRDPARGAAPPVGAAWPAFEQGDSPEDPYGPVKPTTGPPAGSWGLPPGPEDELARLVS
ncbi:hypothetical protein [Paractinoplanes deccanensis]|uniref:hypothetical protein n=1 Tax=Paractinoplanes deccanensis TaxID=113561 RepID=UPI0019416211|nr:hypothetical protein [Actinoplanes deccanensis]